MEVLAERLKWLREQKRLSQKEIAANIGVTLSGLQKMMYNESNPKIDTLVRMAKYFEVTTDFLLGLTDDTDELIKLRRELRRLKDSLEVYEDRAKGFKEEMYKLQTEVSELNYLIHKDGGGDLNTLRLREVKENQLSEIKHHMSYFEHRQQETMLSYNKALSDYVFNFYKIPCSIPENDPIIKELLPFHVVMEEWDIHGYKVRVKSLNGTDLGLLLIVQGEDRNSNLKSAIDALEEYNKFFRIK